MSCRRHDGPHKIWYSFKFHMGEVLLFTDLYLIQYCEVDLRVNG